VFFQRKQRAPGLEFSGFSLYSIYLRSIERSPHPRPIRYLSTSNSTRHRASHLPCHFRRHSVATPWFHSMALSIGLLRPDTVLSSEPVFIAQIMCQSYCAINSAPFPFRGDDYSFIIQAANLTSCPGSCIRPVGLTFSRSGVLYVSSDSSGEVRNNFSMPRF
jgi:hypothetical protein